MEVDAKMCTCAFCVSVYSNKLPIHILVVHPELLFSYWGLLTCVRPMKFYLTLKKGSGVHPRVFRSFDDSMRFVSANVFFHPCSRDVLKWMRVLYKCERGTNTFDQSVASLFVGQDVIPTTKGQTDIVCTQLTPQTGAMPKRKKSIDTTQTPTHNNKRIAVDVDTMHVDPPPCSDEDECGNTSAYDSGMLGGIKVEVARVLKDRPVWDQEAIDALFSWGGTPILHKVGVLEEGNYRKIQCVFVHPSGSLVKGIWLPFGLIKAIYPKQVSHIK